MKSWLIAITLGVPLLVLTGPVSGASQATAVDQKEAAEQQQVNTPTSDTLKEDVFEGWEADTPGEEELAPQDPNEATDTWLDSSHGYATDRAQELTQWMDDYFGTPNYEIEQAESLIRLDFITDWDEEDKLNNNIRLRGKLQLPKVSRRLNLVFSGEEGDELDPGLEERKLDDNFGLLYEVSESRRSRFDLTMGITWNRLRPGVRYRFQDSLGEFSSYRLTQRVQWESDEGFYSTSQAEINRALDENTFLRWNNRVVYGEETDGAEWITRLSLFQRRESANRKRRLGINFFGSVNGVTDPESYVKNYRLGVLFRRQIYRKFLFLELEPAYNYRQREPDETRKFAWSIALRLQIALERDLRSNKKQREKGVAPDPADDNIGMLDDGESPDTIRPDALPASASL